MDVGRPVGLRWQDLAIRRVRLHQYRGRRLVCERRRTYAGRNFMGTGRLFEPPLDVWRFPCPHSRTVKDKLVRYFRHLAGR